MDGLTRRAAIWLGLISGPAIRATLASQDRPATRLPSFVPPTLDVAIAVPIYDDTRPITIGPGRHFHVVVSNRSDRALRVWDDHCSQGEFNVAFEVVEGEVARVIRRIGQDWAKNIPFAAELQPGDQFVSEVSFDPARWELPWADAEIKTRRVRMRAIYEIGPGELAEKEGVWTGRIASRYGEYTIRDNRR